MHLYIEYIEGEKFPKNKLYTRYTQEHGHLNFLRKVNDMREIVLIKYYNVCFYLAFQRGKDEINKQCLVKRIESGAATNMKEIAGWCDAHKIPFATKFKYRKDFPLKANIWNLYSYFRFLYTRKIVLEK